MWAACKQCSNIASTGQHAVCDPSPRVTKHDTVSIYNIYIQCQQPPTLLNVIIAQPLLGSHISTSFTLGELGAKWNTQSPLKTAQEAIRRGCADDEWWPYFKFAYIFSTPCTQTRIHSIRPISTCCLSIFLARSGGAALVCDGCGAVNTSPGETDNKTGVCRIGLSCHKHWEETGVSRLFIMREGVKHRAQICSEVWKYFMFRSNDMMISPQRFAGNNLFLSYYNERVWHVSVGGCTAGPAVWFLLNVVWY